MRRHTISISEMNYEAPSILGSAASARGSKRLTMFTNPTTGAIVFQVSSGSAVRDHVELAAALDDYNGIDI